MWKIIYSKEALEELGKLDLAVQKQIMTKLAEYRWFNYPRHTFGLKFKTDFWPVRCDNYRILCKVDSNSNVVQVVIIEPHRWADFP